MYDRRITHFKELYNPSTRCFQIWLAILAFTFTILANLFKYKNGEVYVLDMIFSNFAMIYKGFLLTVFVLFGLLVILSIISLAIITIKSLIKRKIESPTETRQREFNAITTKVNELKSTRDMIDKCLKDINNKPPGI